MEERFKQSLRGINAICITPFDTKGEIDYAALGRNLEHLLDSGLQAIYPCGNTGEFYSLTVEEAKETARYAVRHVQGRARVIVGVGHDARTAALLAAHAEQIGADGLMIHQPPHPFQHEEGLVEYYRQIAAASRLPLVLYARGEAVTLRTLELAAQLPQIAGVKYAVNDLPAFAAAVQAIGRRFVWICGTAEGWAPFFYAAGAEGFTSGLVNVAAERSLALHQALQAARYEEAMRIWQKLRPFEAMRERQRSAHNVSVVKTAMELLGLLDNSEVRAPLAPLSASERAELAAVLKEWERASAEPGHSRKAVQAAAIQAGGGDGDG